MSDQQKGAVWVPDLGNGQFRNPIIHADYSDPDIVRAGDDFYLVASSFAHAPGLPVLHSKDLVNWKLINYVIDRLDLPGYDLPQHGKGVWAPSIRYHDGKFWVFFSTPDEGIFMSTATDPAGKWSPLHQVAEAKGWIDPCPFWDEDGQAYLVHAFAASRAGIKHRLRLFRMAPDGTRLLDEGREVFDGTERHPTMEGPKMYKRNGYYYIFAPAGGVKPGWQTILRSRNIYGPYEDKVVLHQGDTDINGPHQGGWVELESGESWFVHFQDKYAFGRVVHLQPVRWADDWPLMGEDTNGDGIGEPVTVYRKPDVGAEYPVAVPPTSDDFGGKQLGLQWQWQANPQENWYELGEGRLRLYARALRHGRSLYEAPQLLMQKFPAPEFTATAETSFVPDSEGDRAGLVVFGRRFAYLALSADGSQYRLALVVGTSLEERVREEEETSVRVPPGKVFLRVKISEDSLCRFSYSTDGDTYHAIGGPFKAEAGHWVGAKVGIFAVNLEDKAGRGYADFHRFAVTR
jgi:beta-xylosidase